MLTVAGPTAVGKTALILELAKKYNSHIFSADSRQIYKELKIGTAKPSDSELKQTIHHFINHVSIHDEFNVSHYETEINDLFESYFKNNDVGILSGGTGMYIKAALEGLDHFPYVSESIKEEYDNLFLKKGLNYLQEEIKQKDSEYAKTVDLSNSRRIIRALSIIKASGNTYSSYLNKKESKRLPFYSINICLIRDRALLYERINTRVDQMMNQGLLEEVRGLIEFQNLKSLQTVGYSELFKYFKSDISLETAIELIKRNSRRYAKRQMTWFRNQGNWTYINAADHNTIFNFIEKEVNNFNKN